LVEWGKTYYKVSQGNKQVSYPEENFLGLWMTEKEAYAHWKTGGNRADFFSLKGSFEGLLDRLGISAGQAEEMESSPLLGQGLQWKKGDRVLAVLGSVHTKLCKHFDIKGEVFFAQLNWDLCLELLQNRKAIQYTAVPKFPVVRRDLALLVDQGVRFAHIEQQALKAENRLLKSVGLFDVYEGKELPKGKKSYAIQLLLQDENKTLTDKQIDKMVQKITQRLQNELQAELR